MGIGHQMRDCRSLSGSKRQDKTLIGIDGGRNVKVHMPKQWRVYNECFAQIFIDSVRIFFRCYT